MAELLKSGAVFIHIPKTGGSWVRDVLQNADLLHRDRRIGYKHSTTEHVNNILRYHRWRFIRHRLLRPMMSSRKLRAAFKFCFVRNPLHWYESWWKSMAGRWRPRDPGRWHPQRPIDDCADDDFNGFIAKILQRRPGYVGEMYEWYVEGVDFVGKTENLANDLLEVLRALGVEADADAITHSPRVNVSKALRGSPKWDPTRLAEIIESERPTIERFGYAETVSEFARTQGVSYR